MYKETYRGSARGSGVGPRIVVIGGGTGLSVLLRGLKKISTNITAIVTVADDGGGSGMLRDDYGMLPPGDVRNCILALSDEEDIMEQLLQFRFGEGRLKGQNMGNLFIAALTEIYGDFEMAIDKLHEVLRIKGKVIPVTSESVTLCAELEDGRIIRGESQIPYGAHYAGKRIRRVFLDPECPTAVPAAIDSILAADAVILGPGSLYTSIIPNLLVDGISEAIRSAGGIKILICNVMTQIGETEDYTVSDYVDAIEDYLGNRVLEYLLVNNHIVSPEELAQYVSRGTKQMFLNAEDRKKLQEKGIVVVESNMIHLGEKFIHHDADRISNILMSIIHGA